MTTVPLYRLTLALYPAAILMLPIGNAVARTGSDRTRLVWALLAVAMLLKVSANMACESILNF